MVSGFHFVFLFGALICLAAVTRAQDNQQVTCFVCGGDADDDCSTSDIYFGFPNSCANWCVTEVKDGLAERSCENDSEDDAGNTIEAGCKTNDETGVETCYCNSHDYCNAAENTGAKAVAVFLAAVGAWAARYM